MLIKLALFSSLNYDQEDGDDDETCARMCIEQHHHYHSSSSRTRADPRKEDPRAFGRTSSLQMLHKVRIWNGAKSWNRLRQVDEIWKHCREPSGHRSAINGQDLNPEIRSIHNSWTELRNSVAYAVTLAIPRRTSHRLGLRSNMIYLSTTQNDGRGLYL